MWLLLVVQIVLAPMPASGSSSQVRVATRGPRSATAVPVVTGNPAIDGAERIALAVLAHNMRLGTHIAAPFYDSPWIRDSFAWGMVPWSGSATSPLYAYSGSELRYWLKRQRQDGLWITNQWSGWYDETPALIAAICDSYLLTGDRRSLRRRLPQAEHAWSTLVSTQVRPAHGSRYLIFAAIGPHTATDWADQIARRGYATGVEALWYHATRSMALMESALGRKRSAASYTTFARGIAHDINRLLWKTGPPHARNAAAAPATGHYTGWLGPRDYFEVDSNFLCILYGIASSAQAAAITRFTSQHATYLLRLGVPGGMPARVVYGDYEPADRASIHYAMADGAYQNAYWPSVGALVAIGYARTGQQRMARSILEQIARGFLAEGTIHEWYRMNGRPSGAAFYQWPARMYLIALYSAYLGLGDGSTIRFNKASSPLRKYCLGSGKARIQSRGVDLLAIVKVGRQAAPSQICTVTVSQQR